MNLELSNNKINEDSNSGYKQKKEICEDQLFMNSTFKDELLFSNMFNNSNDFFHSGNFQCSKGTFLSSNSHLFSSNNNTRKTIQTILSEKEKEIKQLQNELIQQKKLLLDAKLIYNSYKTKLDLIKTNNINMKFLICKLLNSKYDDNQI